MRLSEQLNQFNKQQVRCLTSLPLSSRKPSSTVSQNPPPPYSFSPAAAVVAPVKFSNDTERLQNINAIRKAPVGAQIKRVIDLLFETRQAFTPEQINEACYVDMHTNKDVFNSLKANPKAHYDGRRFSYKATHDVKNKKGILDLVNRYLDGLPANDLKDAYPNVIEDLQALKASGDIWLLSNGQEEIVYPNNFKVGVKVDDDLKALFRDIDIPNDMLDVEKELVKIGLKPVTNTAERKAAAQSYGVSKDKSSQKKKRKEITKRTKLTNAHLPELFQSS